jgi:hypothetical protein
VGYVRSKAAAKRERPWYRPCRTCLTEYRILVKHDATNPGFRRACRSIRASRLLSRIGPLTRAAGPHAAVSPDAAVLPAARFAEIPGISPGLAAAIIAGTGPGMTRFPTRAPAVLGRAAPLREPLRPPHPGTRKATATTTCAATYPSRHQSRPLPLPRRAIPPHRPPPRQVPRLRRRRPLHPGHHLLARRGARAAEAAGRRGPHRTRLQPPD